MTATHRPRPGNPASAVYGTVLAAGQLAVESATGHGTGAMAASLAATMAVFWVAYAYTDTLGSTIGGTADDPPTVAHALREEWPIVESAALPLITLGLGALAGARPSSAALAALLVSVIELLGWSLLAARRARLTGWRRLRYCAAVTLLGVALVGLKYLIH